ncbi:Insect cuticle protein [Trinorchestia longiramus]|nr:Insect cuticle protein [Trinorchestia longiramus]
MLSFILGTNIIIKFFIIHEKVIFLALAATAVARPDQDYSAPARGSNERHIAILRDDRVQPQDGSYAFDIETEDGIVRSEAGQNQNEAGVVVQAGQMSYTLPDGTLFELKFVADENGYQPQSDFLPVAPAPLHPIPAFVQEQIDRAERERSASLANSQRSYQ